MTRIIAVMLAKGGVGKTTTSVSLAAGLANAGRRVLLIDTDTQGQVCHALGVDTKHGLYELVEEGVAPGDVLLEARSNLYVLAGGRQLAMLERAISRKDFRPESTLSNALTPLNEYFDYVIIDTAPAWGTLAVNVLTYAEELLCPVTLETLAVQGLIDFLERVQPIIQHTGSKLSYVLPTMLDRRFSQTREIMEQLQEHFGSLLCEPIRANIRLSEAPAHGQHIFEYEPKSRGAADYKQLTQRVINDEQA